MALPHLSAELWENILLCLQPNVADDATAMRSCLTVSRLLSAAADVSLHNYIYIQSTAQIPQLVLHLTRHPTKALHIRTLHFSLQESDEEFYNMGPQLILRLSSVPFLVQLAVHLRSITQLPIYTLILDEMRQVLARRTSIVDFTVSCYKEDFPCANIPVEDILSYRNLKNLSMSKYGGLSWNNTLLVICLPSKEVLKALLQASATQCASTSFSPFPV